MEGVVFDEARACWWMKIKATSSVTEEKIASGSRGDAALDKDRLVCYKNDN